MYNYHVTIHSLLPLMQSIEKRLQSTKVQMAERQYAAVHSMLREVAVDIQKMDNTIISLERAVKEYQHEGTKEAKDDLDQSMKEALMAYQMDDLEEFEKEMKQVIGAFIVWRTCIEEPLRPGKLS